MGVGRHFPRRLVLLPGGREVLVQVVKQALIVVGHDRGGEAFLARAARPPDAVHVPLDLRRQVEIDDVRDTSERDLSCPGKRTRSACRKE